VSRRIAPFVQFAILALIAVFAAGCATSQPEVRRFFGPELEVETHGRKSWLDKLIEVDPGRFEVQIAEDYQERPPLRIAVLPFADDGPANFIINKVPVSFRNESERQQWAWTYSNRLRKAVAGYLARREFIVVNLLTVDAVLVSRGIDNREKLMAVSSKTLGEWLGADTLVYGELVDYEAYYFLLVASWRVGVNLRMVSAIDGRETFSAAHTRYSVDLRPAFSPMDIALNSLLTTLELREVKLARAEEEVGREIVLQLPVAHRNVALLSNKFETPED